MKNVIHFTFLIAILTFPAQTGCGQQETLLNRHPDYQLQATSIFQEFVKNEEVSNLKYQGKVLEIMGTIQAIQRTNHHSYRVLLNSNHKQGWIQCECYQLSPAALLLLKVGDVIQIKGQFAGFEKYVLLSPCLII